MPLFLLMCQISVQDGGFLEDLFSDTTGIGHFTMPTVNVALGTVSTASSNAFMLPAGDVFFFKVCSIVPFTLATCC